jgi:hypothetical protein
VFKRVEKQAMDVMESTRAQAQQRARVSKKGPELFPAEQVHKARRLTDLRSRYLGQAQKEAKSLFDVSGKVAYDTVWSKVMKWPLVWEADFKGWLDEWKAQGMEIKGLKPRQRVPKVGDGVQLVWKSAQGTKQQSLFDT